MLNLLICWGLQNGDILSFFFLFFISCNTIIRRHFSVYYLVTLRYSSYGKDRKILESLFSSFQDYKLISNHHLRETNSFFSPQYYYELMNLNIIFTTAQIVPVGASSGWFLSPFDMRLGVFKSFIMTWYDKMFQVHLANFLHQTWIQAFLQEVLLPFSKK